MSEKEIIKKLQKGDLSALKRVWDEHSQHVLNLAFRMLLDREQAEDILMDVFVQISEAIQKFRGESSLSTCLYTLTKNACLMKLRSDKVHLTIETDRHLEIEERAIGRSERADAILDKDALAYGLSILTPDQRSLLWLKDAEGLDIKILSEIYNAPEGTLKARLSRARAQVRQVLDKETAYA